MKNKITAVLALLLCLCLAASSCGADISALEGFCFAVQDFDIDAANKCVLDGSEKYFERVLAYFRALSDEQKETAKKLFSKMAFSEFKENDGVCTLNVKYVNFQKLIKTVENDVVTGSTATESLERILESGRIEMQFTEIAKEVKVTLSKAEGKAYLTLGYLGENEEFTRILGLDTFLGWYSEQR